MLIPKKTRLLVYKHLFMEGVMCAKDAPNAPKHHELDVPNLHVCKLMQSLASRGLVNKQYSWRWFYWYLTNEGVAYLREFLGTLPENVLPKTHMKAAARPNPTGRPFGGERGERPGGFGGERREGGFGRGRDGRDSYRSGPREGGFGRGGAGKEGGAPGGDVQPAFRGGGRGGFGRGRE